eukprot:1465529-Alexandrium_andersonii.AAC.1
MPCPRLGISKKFELPHLGAGSAASGAARAMPNTHLTRSQTPTPFRDSASALSDRRPPCAVASPRWTW